MLECEIEVKKKEKKVLPALSKRGPLFENENCLQNFESWVYS